MTQPYLGEVRMFGGNFAIRGWALCNGQLMSIQQNSALFSLLGTTYGGDGVQTFALPNLQSRVAIGQGNGAGLSPRVIGQAAGVETVTLTTAQMPAHSHSFVASMTGASSAGPGSSYVCGTPSNASAHFYTINDGSQPPPTPEKLTGASCSNVGSNLPHENLMPYLCVSFLIALQGIFPSRN